MRILFFVKFAIKSKVLFTIAKKQTPKLRDDGANGRDDKLRFTGWLAPFRYDFP